MTDNDRIFDLYEKSRQPKFILESSVINVESCTVLKELYEQDLQHIEDLLNEGRIGEFFKNIGTRVKNFATDKLIKPLIDAILSKVPQDQRQAFGSYVQQFVSSGKVPPEATQEASTITGSISSQQQLNASYNKTYLAQNFLTETLIYELLCCSVLLEGANDDEIQKIAKDAAARIQQLYPNDQQATQSALQQFNTQFNQIITSTGQQQPQNQQAATSTQQQPQDQQAATAPQQGGFVQKILSAIKNRPILSAVAAVGLISAITAATGGAAVPVLLASLKAAGIGGAVDATKQYMTGGKVDWKQTAKSAAMGGAFGAAGQAAGQAVGAIARGIGSHAAGANVAATPTSTPQQAVGELAAQDGVATSSNAGNLSDELRVDQHGNLKTAYGGAGEVNADGTITSDTDRITKYREWEHAHPKEAALIHNQRMYDKVHGQGSFAKRQGYELGAAPNFENPSPGPALSQALKTNPQMKEIFDDLKQDKNAIKYLNGLSQDQLNKIVSGSSPNAVDTAIEKIKTASQSFAQARSQQAKGISNF